MQQAQAPYTNLYLEHNPNIKDEQFPTSSGGRYHTFIRNKVDEADIKVDEADIAEFSKGILTLLKVSLYSLSIKLEKTIDVNNLKNKFNGDIYVFDIQKNCYKINDELNDKQASHILIIGTIQDYSQNENPIDFKITKTYLIINDEINDIAKHTEGVSSEEYLNLYYIEHFSLDIIEFMDIYNKYIDTEVTQQGEEDTREDLTAVLEIANSAVQDAVQVVDGAGGPDKGGGKKLASKVKKNKNKKNKVV